MTLPSDPILLYGFINMKLRDEYSTLTALCDDYDVSADDVIEKLKAVGYDYDEAINQFR